MILHMLKVDLMNSVTFHAALLPQTVRWINDATVLAPMWRALGYPVAVKYRMGAWG